MRRKRLGKRGGRERGEGIWKEGGRVGENMWENRRKGVKRRTQ